MTLAPCITCGEPTDNSYCAEHAPPPWHHQGGAARDRGYDAAWDRLSRRARKIQPWCSDCGTTNHLTADHLPTAWARKAEGKSIRLQDVDVVCNDCNLRRGSSRPEKNSRREPRGDAPVQRPQGPLGGAKFQTEIGTEPGVGR